MSWFDNIPGASSVMNWMHGPAAPAAAAPAHAPAAPAPAAPAAAAPAVDHGWGNSTAAKATGLAPWAKMLGVGQGNAPAAAAPAPVGGGSGVANKVSGEGLTKQGFARDTEKGGFKTPEYSNWGATGKSYGNRKDDVEAKDGGKDIKVKGPSVWQPDLSKIGNKDDPRSWGTSKSTGVLSKSDAEAAIDKGGGATGYSDSGSFRSSKYGGYSGGTGLFAKDKDGKWAPDNKMSANHSGQGNIGIGGWEGQWGAEEKGGWRATAMSANKQHSASAEAGWVASGGASASAGLDTKNGLNASAGIGGKVGGYAQADADTKTGSVKVGGVDFDAGAGAHGEVFAGAKAGASGMIGVGPDFVGAKGEIGAFAGAEAAGDIHANLGPVGGKVGGSLMAGAGIGADGDISYKDGKFHVGGKLFAALGYGGSLSGDVTIDVGAAGRAIGGLATSAYEGASNLASSAADGISNAASAVLSW